MAPQREEIVIPGWFVKMGTAIIGLFMALFIPWASWLTLAVNDMRTQIATGNAIRQADKADIERLERRVDALERFRWSAGE